MVSSPNRRRTISHLSDNELQFISELVIKKITDNLIKQEPSSESLNNYLINLEPKKKVLEQKEFSTAVRVGGWIILFCCVWYWIWYFFVVKDFEPLIYTTYITLILISLTCINKFESVLLNSVTCISAYGFITVSIWLAFVVKDFGTLLGGPILHGAMAAFQLYLVFHKKIALSKRYLFFGFLFYLIFMNSIDQIARLIIETNSEALFTDLMTAVFSFYILSVTCFGIYFYKKKYGILYP
ncbi:MAG: hypothetical protein ACFFAH_14675 [Promethearchaeota archaeon]